MLNDTAAKSGFNQNRKPAKASRVKRLVTGAATAMPTKFPGSVSSVLRALTTVPGWVFLKKFSGRVRI